MTTKTLGPNDVVTTRTILHENIPITGTILSGTYATSSTSGRGLNIKSYAHGMYQSVYDYPYLSSSANHIFDIATGFSATGSSSLSSSAVTQVSKKVNIYNQMAQVLAGYDISGSVRRFDEDGDLSGETGKIENAVFLNFSRLLVKDEIKKGSFSLNIGNHNSYSTPFSTTSSITDSASAQNYRTNSPAGEYGFLKSAEQAASVTLSSESDSGAGQTISFIALKADGSLEAAEEFTATNADNTNNNFARGGADAGLSNLKARIEANDDIKDLVTVSAVTRPGGDSGPYEMTITQKHPGTAGNTAIDNGLSGMSINGGANDADGAFVGGVDNVTTGLIYYQAGVAVLTSSVFGASSQIMNNATSSHGDALKKGSIGQIADGVRNRIQNIKFSNNTELNSTVYFCRANNRDFNYSTNPTYLSQSKIFVKTNPGTTEAANLPISYITTVGLYSPANELLAVAKLSEPLKKTPQNELTLRVRLDF
jgi:hypothetical protein